MENPIVSWLFETDAVRVCPEGQPFWYTSGKLGPFYINTQFLYGSEEAANALLTVIEQACAGDKLRFYDKVYGEIEKQLAACPIYRQLIDLMTEAARKMDVDFVSGGERRDFFFSMPVARKLGLGHLSIFKDLSSVYTDANGVSMPAGQASLSGKRSVHIADLVTVASSYIRAWIPAVEGLGAKIACSLAVVDRDQGGSKILADAGCPLTTLVVIKPELFETAHKNGPHHRQAACARAAFHRRSGCVHAQFPARPSGFPRKRACQRRQKRSARAALYRQRLRPCRSPAQSLMQLSLLPLDPPPCLRYFIRADGRHAGGDHGFTPFRARSFPTASPFQRRCADGESHRQHSRFCLKP